jgi:hypothetical protein
MTDTKHTPPVPPRAGVIAAGFEFPPRLYPPDPQHLDIVQTYDPRVSVQMERASRDLAAGKPGTAAQEDLERGGPAPTPAATAEGGVQRETPVTFNTQFASYYAGETAAFTPEEAARLAELGVVGEGGPSPPATDPPGNVDVPVVSQAGDTLTCTMGNWTGTPTGYAYQWQLDGADVGSDAATHTVTSADAGKSAACVVTATNAIGSTAAPASNAVVVTDPGAAR